IFWSCASMSRSAFSSDSSICPEPPPGRAVRTAPNIREAEQESPAGRRLRGVDGETVDGNRELLLRRADGVLVLGAVQVAVAILVGGRKGLDQFRIGGSFGHRDAAVLVGIERVEREGLARVRLRCRLLRAFGGHP